MFDYKARIRAARGLAGFTLTELAEQISEPGLRASTLRNLERGRREPAARDLHAIARACRLPDEWFTVDFTKLTELQQASKSLAEEISELKQSMRSTENKLSQLYRDTKTPA